MEKIQEFSRLAKGVANQIPGDGYPVGTMLDIVVDLTAPVAHGRYISYWRMMSPSGTCRRCDKFSSYYEKLKMVLKVARKKMRRLMSYPSNLPDQCLMYI
ncbi:hypothetical protein C5167_027663 [Papaver somniferum]|nr:hypothetical protein C5167_027663 [Papaver somniferum]